jgi:hypothetical protein
MPVIIGMDPHKRSATIEVVDERAQILAVGRFGTDKVGYGEMLAAGREYPDRVWAVEGCNGIGKHIAHRLVHDGETVVDVPPKLSARVRVFATGNAPKSDPSVTVAAGVLPPHCSQTDRCRAPGIGGGGGPDRSAWCALEGRAVYAEGVESDQPTQGEGPDLGERIGANGG